MCCKENLFFERICFMLQTDWNGKPYHALDYELKKIFGKKVYKLALDGGMTCPNRDGTLGRGGCIFCSAGGSGDFAEKQAGSLREQADLAKARVSRKISGDDAAYIAYFQSYTNTYAPLSYLKQLFSEAISLPEICALSIGTRPDCLPDETIELLSRLNKEKPVWIEPVSYTHLVLYGIFSSENSYPCTVTVGTVTRKTQQSFRTRCRL